MPKKAFDSIANYTRWLNSVAGAFEKNTARNPAQALLRDLVWRNPRLAGPGTMELFGETWTVASNQYGWLAIRGDYGHPPAIAELQRQVFPTIDADARSLGDYRVRQLWSNRASNVQALRRPPRNSAAFHGAFNVFFLVELPEPRWWNGTVIANLVGGADRGEVVRVQLLDITHGELDWTVLRILGAGWMAAALPLRSVLPRQALERMWAADAAPFLVTQFQLK